MTLEKCWESFSSFSEALFFVKDPIEKKGTLLSSMTCCFIRHPEMRSNFNQLLVTLAVLDIAYVATGIWDYSCVKVFNIQNMVYAFIFPYFWYPMKNILMSWTTFLTMGLATERYLAVCR